MSDVFYWIGVSVVVVAAAFVAIAGALWAYFNLIDGRFHAILFRKSARRLSIASWHESRLTRKGQTDSEDWPADDWPVNKRPLYLSCRIGQRRLFMLAGLLSGPRDRVIRGEHPEGKTP